MANVFLGVANRLFTYKHLEATTRQLEANKTKQNKTSIFARGWRLKVFLEMC